MRPAISSMTSAQALLMNASRQESHMRRLQYTGVRMPGLKPRPTRRWRGQKAPPYYARPGLRDGGAKGPALRATVRDPDADVGFHRPTVQQRRCEHPLSHGVERGIAERRRKLHVRYHLNPSHVVDQSL